MTGTLVPPLGQLDDQPPVMPADGAGTERPVWLTRGRWPLFAWVHDPGAPPAASVVLCPPLLGEQLSAHSMQRVVARSLAGSGLLAVRFDYEGTGDSGGPQGGPSRASTWQDGVDQAVALARSRCDGPVALVGVRSGALVAAQAAVRLRDVDVLVLWDPWSSGHGFLRRQRALQSLRLHGTSASGDTEVPGFTVDRSTVEAIEGLRLPASLPVRRALLMARPKSEMAAPVLTPRGGGAGGVSPAQESADVLLAVEGEQESCFEIEPLRRQVPSATATAVVDWIAGAVKSLAKEIGEPDPNSAVPRAGRGALDPSSGSDATWATGAVTIGPAVPGDVTVTERVRSMGPHRLFAIETVPGASPGGDLAAQPTVLFLSSGTDSHIGPARLWVTLARRLAGSGLRCVRVDLSGLGDSDARSGHPEGVIRAPEAFDDVAEVVAAAGNPRTVVLAGLCSGAYQALESALELHPLGVVAVNPLLRFTPPEVEDGAPLSARRRLCQPRPVWMAGARRALPEPVGRAMASARRMVGRARATTRPRHATWVGELGAANVDVYCVCGEDEASQLHEAGFVAGVHARTHLDLIPGLDHGLTVASQRDAVADRVTRAVQAIAGTAVDGAARRRSATEPSGGGRP